ncbi:MAG TPA: aldo/keto reductase [Myxococcota bacterium]|nr:aldo/keto reductase [Myxococcota bacterium]
MSDGGIDRRTFLQGSAAAGLLALAPAGALAAAGADAPRVQRTVRLGRTGLQVPDIGFGTSRLSGDEALVRYALDRGITYFDSAESYTDGRAEETLGRALAGVREKVALTSKVIAEPDTKRQKMMEALEGSLKRLRTDRIDVYFSHSVNHPGTVQNPEWAEFVVQAKKQGKIRFSGVSGHGGRLAECLEYVLDHDLVDVVLVAHNFGQDPAFYEKFTASMDFVAVQPELPRLLAKAKARDVGVVAMKTLRGARLNDMRPYEKPGGTFAQAAFRWVLAQPFVDALVVTMTSQAQVDEYLGASGATRTSRDDLRLLALYETRNGATQCRPACGGCEGACPEGVPIADALRTRMYARDYGDPAFAQREYALLGNGAAACASCAHQACASACPFGVPIPELTRPLHGWLSGAERANGAAVERA